jgi:glucose-1-phosphate thymidylyltransferase
MEIAKALILVGSGDGRQAWPGVPGSRHLFPVANRPILFHNLEAIRSAGILEATILADSGAVNAIRGAVGDGRDWGLSVRHAEWRTSPCLLGALAASRDFIADEPVLVEHGDALLRGRMHQMISAFARERLDALAVRLEQPPAGRRGPRTPAYLLSSRAVSLLLDRSAGSANLVADLEARGGRVRVESVVGCLPCDGDLDDLLASNRCVLEGIAASVEPGSLADSTVHGTVQIHPTATIRRSLVRGPVIIGPNATISDAYVGPYTAIGAGVTVEASEIEHSIVLPEAELRFVGTRLESSVIGHRARIVRGFDVPAAMRVSLGEGAEVVLR